MAQKPPKKVSHFTWPDVLVLLAAVLILPVAIYERNWFFMSLGVVFAAVIGIRVLVTKWLVNRTPTPK